MNGSTYRNGLDARLRDERFDESFETIVEELEQVEVKLVQATVVITTEANKWGDDARADVVAMGNAPES